MSLLTRVTDFTPGSIIQSQPFDDEFNQLVNILSGVSSNKSIKVISNDDTFAVARFDQRGVNNILELYANGAEVGRVEKDGDLVVNGLTGAAGIYTFTSIPLGPNADPSSANQLSRKSYIDNKKIYSMLVFPVDDPSTYSVSSNACPVWIAPTSGGSAFVVTRFGVLYNSGSHTAAANLTFELVVNGSLTGQQISLNNTNSTASTPYFNDFADITSVVSVWFQLATRSGTITERSVSILVEYYQKPV